jgi:uncharacterized protein with PQ loop repeat
MFITGLAGITHWAASGTIVKRYIDANEDSQLVAASLPIWAAHGVNEALAAPILS